MTSINNQSALQMNASSLETGLTLPSTKPVANKNYLVKQASPLNSILGANKRTLGPKEASWTTATKAVLASTGILGLSYLSYHYFGTKPAPSPPILPNISVGDLMGTTIKVVGGLCLLTLAKYALSIEKTVLQKFKEADKNFSINKQINISNKELSKEEDKFIITCAETTLYLYECDLPLNEEQHNLIKSVSISFHERIANPVGNPYYFWGQVYSFFSALLAIDTDSAFAIAKTCVNLEDHTHCRDIIDKALQNSQIGPSLIIFCAQQENNPKYRQIAEQMSILFLDGRFQFAEFLKKIASVDSENLQEFILNEFNKIIETTSKYASPWKKEIALINIREAIDLFVNAKNYKMAILLLQKCVETGDKSLQNLADVQFDKHEKTLLEASPRAAKELSNDLQIILIQSIDRSFDSPKEETQKNSSEQKQTTPLLEGSK